MRLGYCCINLSLNEGKKDSERIYTNRSLTKKTFLEGGLKRASELALKNVQDLEKIIEWNKDNRIGMFRMSSDMFPWCSEYEISELPDFEAIREILILCGNRAKEYNQRLTFHPSHFCVIASLRDDVVKNSVKELRQHAEIMDLMGLDQSFYYPINVHINTTKPDKESAAARFCEAYLKLPDNVKKRLVLENDDKPSEFNPFDLYELVHKQVGIPLTFDYLHYFCNPRDGQSEKEALEVAISSWPDGIVPITHYSESRKLNEDEGSKLLAHTDWIWNRNIETYGFEIDIEFEVKMKDLALLKYLKNQT